MAKNPKKEERKDTAKRLQADREEHDTQLTAQQVLERAAVKLAEMYKDTEGVSVTGVCKDGSEVTILDNSKDSKDPKAVQDSIPSPRPQIKSEER